ncbi:MAG: exonuclease SbcCD subunit D C-terminal domain-containing protein [Chlamydiales bacterium]|nr:exonuclease SbcCD subunit D C-terminal domain-containing protein [Chlamydiales bacterium]
MKILHTADWHLGKTLCKRKRYDEFEAFLAWLTLTINEQKVDVLLVAGDVFDTTAPSNRSQELYYCFLRSIANSSCRHIVITGGNHDSPTFLNAPKELLQVLDIHVIGAACENLEDEVILLRDSNGHPELIVCAIPYLRDRDIRTAEIGESIDEKAQKLHQGTLNHYTRVCELAEEKRIALDINIPIVAMGHLFTAGGQTIEGDGVRDLHVGSLAHVNPAVFPKCIDYLALGHLHVPQKVGGSEFMRYSGSPIPMGFGEAYQKKSVCLVEFNDGQPQVKLIEIPVFQQLERIRGTIQEIEQRITELSANNSNAWLDIAYSGDEVINNLQDRLKTMISETKMELLSCKNERLVAAILSKSRVDETLDDLNVNEVFERFLAVNQIPVDQHPMLVTAYREAVLSLQEEDFRAL